MLTGYNRFTVIAGRNGDRAFQVKAMNAGPGTAGSGANATTVGKPTGLSILEGFIDTKDEKSLRDIHRDMYYHDPIAGSTVDLYSNLPFGDFSLSGVPDGEILYTYLKSIERIRVKTLLPALSTDYLVDGAFLGVLNYNSRERLFDSVMPQNLEFADLVPVPIFGQSPLVTLKFPGELKKLLTSKDPRLQKVRDQIPEKIKDGILKGKIDLDPANVVYIPRRTLSSRSLGTSYFRRLLPIYLLEKALMRGTIEMAYRRQRGILHIMAGGEDWEPTNDELSSLANLFMCLSGDTLVSQNNRLTRLDEICSRQGKSKDQGEQIDLEIKGKDGKVVKATKWWYRGKSHVYQVSTKSGYSVKTTKDHRVLVLESGARLVWRKTKDLKIGDYLCLDPNLAQVENTQLLNLELHLPQVVHREQGGGIQPKPINLPKQMSPELAYLLGSVISEGELTKHYVRIINSQSSFLDKIEENFQSVFALNVSRKIASESGSKLVINGAVAYRNHDTECLVAQSTLVSAAFQQLGLKVNEDLRTETQGPSHRKEIPWSILQADDASKYAFLAAYLDGDGHLVTGQNETGETYLEIQFTSVSKRLLKQLQILLLDLGIRSNRVSGHPHLHVNRTDAPKLYRKIRSYLTHPDKILPEKTVFSTGHDHGIPVSNFQQELSHVNFRGWKTISSDLHRPGCQLRYATAKKGHYDKYLATIQEHAPELHARLQRLLKIGYLFEPITTLEKKSKKVHLYDLSITPESSPAFVANGIIVHNSADMDPLGAVVATRPDILVNDVQMGGEFWKIEDSAEFLSTMKLRALGVSESFLSGDAAYNCVTGDTLVPTENGLIRIDQIASGDKETINLKVAGRYEPEVAKTWLYSGIAPTLKVEAQSGHVVRGTPKHPMLVLRNNQTVWVPLKELQIGDLLCINPKQITRKTPLQLNLTPSKELTIVREVGAARDRKKVIRPETMTPELAYLLGCLIAEGAVDTGSRISFYNSDLELLSKVETLYQTVFGLQTIRHLNSRSGTQMVVNGVSTVSNHDYWVLHANSQTVSDWLRELGVYSQSGRRNGKTASHYKEVPWSVLQADEGSQYAFLAAYIEGDGWIRQDDGRIGIKSASQKLLRQLQIMANALGYLPNIQGSSLIFDAVDSAELWIHIQEHMVSKFYPERIDVRKCRNQYGFPGDYLKKELQQRKVLHDRNGIVFLNDQGQEVRIRGWKNPLNGNKMFLYDQYDRGDYNQFLEHLKLISVQEHHKLVELLNLRYRFTPVIAITKGKNRKVYDLSMTPGTEPAFVANGLVVHNTVEASLSIFIQQVRAYRELITRSFFYEKLFPYLAVTNDFVRDEGKGAAYGHVASFKDMAREMAAPNGRRVFGNKETNYYIALSDGTRSNDLDGMIDISQYHLPTINWHNQLRPEADQQYMEVLSQLTPFLPVPMRMRAAAAGLSIAEILQGQAEDLEIRRQVKEYKDAIEGIDPDQLQDPNAEQARLIKALSSLQGGVRRVNMFERKYDPEQYGPRGYTKTGKRRMITAQEAKRIDERMNRMTAEGLAKIAARRNHQIRSGVSPDHSPLGFVGK